MTKMRTPNEEASDFCSFRDEMKEIKNSNARLELSSGERAASTSPPPSTEAGAPTAAAKVIGLGPAPVRTQKTTPLLQPGGEELDRYYPVERVSLAL